jgi:23S rRNA pseudouridine2605 synthase
MIKRVHSQKGMAGDLDERGSRRSPPEPSGNALKRLNKALASAGIGSRRHCDEVIFSGRVEVNGERCIEPGRQVDLSKDRVVVDGSRIRHEEQKVYYILNKPKGYICSQKRLDEKDRLVNDLLPRGQRLFTIGRLDKETTGLILVTNDGDFAQQVIHPSKGVLKSYVAELGQPMTAEDLEVMRKGVYIDRQRIQPVKVAKIGSHRVKVCLSEGKKHEVRLLLLKAGLKVRELKRVGIGHLHLGPLPAGAFRPMTRKDRELIFS